MWVFLIQLAVTALLSIALAPKPQDAKPRALSDVNVPKASPDANIPVLFGTVMVRNANTVWWGDTGTRPIKTKGGKK